MAETDVVAAAVAGNGTDGQGDAHTQGEATGGAAGGKVDWKALGVPDELRPTVEKYKGVADLAKGYSELTAKLGATVQIPGANATPEERKAFYAKLGRPESQDGYELAAVALPKGYEKFLEKDPELLTMAHELDLTKAQFKGLHEFMLKRFAKNVVAAHEAQTKAQIDAEAALKTAWGASHDANQRAAEQVIALGGDQFVKAMNEGPGKNPAIRAGLYEISKLFSNDTLVKGRVEIGAKKAGPRPGMVADFSKSPELAAS